jgi:hypothetical protein
MKHMPSGMPLSTPFRQQTFSVSITRNDFMVTAFDLITVLQNTSVHSPSVTSVLSP